MRNNEERERERGTKLNSAVGPSLKGGRDASAREEKVEGTRGQSTTREAPMGSVKRDRWQYIRDYLDRIHIIHQGASR